MEALEEQIRVFKDIVAKQSIEMEFKTKHLNLPAGVPAEGMQAGKSQSLDQRLLRLGISSNQNPWSQSSIC